VSDTELKVISVIKEAIAGLNQLNKVANQSIIPPPVPVKILMSGYVKIARLTQRFGPHLVDNKHEAHDF
jgi:hypothetical protein